MERHLCRVRASRKNTAVLKHLNAAGRVVFDHYAAADGDYSLVLTGDEIRLLKLHGVTVALREKPKDAPRRRRRPARRDDDDSDDFLATGFVDDYLDAAEVAARISSLAAEFPALCQLTTLPHMTSGYDGSVASLLGPAAVQMLRITDDPADHSRPGFLLVCGTHAREWVNPLVAIEFAEQLLRNFDPGSADPEVAQVTRIVQEGDVFIVPVMNPDGLNFSRHDDEDWRKNRRPNSNPACPGVDLNRNYEVFFGEGGSSPSECSDGYHGPGPFSEPENRNIRFILEQHPNILIGVDSHSAGQEIFRPTAAGGVAVASLPVFPDDEAVYAELEAAAAAAIQDVSGVTYGTGTTSNHAGTSDEYMFFAHRVFAFDFECALEHRPPIAVGLVSVQEVAAAMRTLALKAVDLELKAATPVSVVQCIDRTGSMVAFGYEEGARANARRFIDMMSIRDEVAVVSFADPSPEPAATPPGERAVVEFPLTEIDDAGDYAAARAAVDGIDFGGWTPIGAGLAKSAAELAGASHPKAVVLLSDGFENRDPPTADALAAFPPDVRVYAVALGGLADVPLLQNVAAQTGGQFYMSPTALGLHEIYNQIRSDVSDDGLVLNEVGGESDGDDAAASPHSAYVEAGAAKLTVSVSWGGKIRRPRLRLIDPFGREVSDRDWGVETTRGDGYILRRIDRPALGRWTVCPEGLEGSYVVAAFVRSPVRLQIKTGWERKGRVRSALIALRAQVPGAVFAPALSGAASLMEMEFLDKKLVFQTGRRETAWTDALPGSLSLHQEPPRARRPGGCANADTLHPLELPARSKAGRADDAGREGAGLYAFRFNVPTAPGVHVARLRVEGRMANGFRFERVALTTLTQVR
jgi:hypothetical protein